MQQQGLVDVRKVSPKKVDELKKDDDYWYADLEPEKKKNPKKTDNQNGNQEERKSLFEQEWFKNLSWIIILCSFIAVVIWYLAASNIWIFRKAPKKILEEGVEEEVTDDIFAISYDNEIQKAVAAGNFRLAIRLWYLRILKELSERSIIDYRYGKTNSDYVAQLAGSRYYRDFFRLTRNFEYTWYGQFDLSAEAYEMMHNDFTQFKNSLP